MRYRGLIATIVAMSGLFLSSTAFAQAPHVLVADEVRAQRQPAVRPPSRIARQRATLIIDE